MTEKEKSQLGLLYNPNYDEMIKSERVTCQTKCFEYNQISPNKIKERTLKIKEIIPNASDEFLIEQPFHCDLGYNITFGHRFFANYNLVILDCAKVTIGDNVFIAPDCGLYTAGHPINAKQRNSGLEYAKPITIGDNVWLGGGVKVMPGVTIGSNVVIGAGSVVTKDIPSGVIAVGNPCKILRKIAPEDMA